jgi:phosphoribosylformimino-5-aminoimidazole carboxamide ribotide isomerase
MSLRVIPVIDLLHGQVVRGVAGQREKYRPIVSQLVDSAEPAAVATALAREFAATEVYVADLDAITRHSPSHQSWQSIAQSGLQLCLDAGIANRASAQDMLSHCSDFPHGVRLVVGLESLWSFADLQQIVTLVSAQRTIFSLDLQHGKPLHSSDSFAHMSAIAIAESAIEQGVASMIVLDLASVGTGQGISTLPLCREISARHAHVELISGGGVRSVADLRALEDAGCAGALVASALHDGSITPADLAAWHRRSQ